MGQARRFLAEAHGHPLEALFTLAVTTGMRQGELLGLRWRDVDWATRRAFVRHTLVRLHGRWWLGEPKTARSERSIELTDATLDVLRAHRDHQAGVVGTAGRRLTGDDLIFSDAAGEPLWGRHVTTLQFKAPLRRAGLPQIRFHDLRHTLATLQLTAGTNPKIVSDVFGHKGNRDHPRSVQPRSADDADRGDGPARRGPGPLAARPPKRPRRPNRRPSCGSTRPRRPLTKARRRDKGADKGAWGPRRTKKKPDPSVDRAEMGGFGTAYRIPSETYHASQPRSPSTSKRRMRQDR